MGYKVILKFLDCLYITAFHIPSLFLTDSAGQWTTLSTYMVIYRPSVAGAVVKSALLETLKLKCFLFFVFF